MKEEVIRIIKDIIEDNGEQLTVEVSNDMKFTDLGLSSFDLATLTVRIEDEFDVDIFEDGLVSTVGEIIAILEANT